MASLVAEVYKQVDTQAYCGTKMDLSVGTSDKQRLVVGLWELCSKSSSLFYSEFPQKLYHYAHYYAQNLLIILIILNF